MNLPDLNNPDDPGVIFAVATLITIIVMSVIQLAILNPLFVVPFVALLATPLMYYNRNHIRRFFTEHDVTTRYRIKVRTAEEPDLLRDYHPDLRHVRDDILRLVENTPQAMPLETKIRQDKVKRSNWYHKSKKDAEIRLVVATKPGEVDVYDLRDKMKTALKQDTRLEKIDGVEIHTANTPEADLRVGEKQEVNSDTYARLGENVKTTETTNESVELEKELE